MKKYIPTFFSSLLAGMLISLGGLIFLVLKNSSALAGAFLFGFGLFTIINLKLDLFTGKIGYVFSENKEYLIKVIIGLIGNIIACLIVGYLLRLTTLFEDNRLSLAILSAIEVSNVKLSSSWLSILILSIFCGVMIYLAVDVSKKDVHPLIKTVAIFLAVAIFIICGFEHCIANTFYFSLANMWNLKSLLYLLIMILGNSIGSIAIYYLLKLAKKH